MGYISYETPDDVFHAVNDEFRFDVDVCAVPDNAKCAKFFTPEQNGLAQDWRGVCWCNPPFDRTKPAWVKKAYESAQAGATVVVLLPWNGTGDTSWWHKYVMRASEIRYLRGRQRYTGLDGRKVTFVQCWWCSARTARGRRLRCHARTRGLCSPTPRLNLAAQPA